MNVGVIFGGKSSEHNISVITGIQVLGALKNEHKAIIIYIDNSGVWLSGKEYGDIQTFRKMNSDDSKKKNKPIKTGKKVHLRPASNWLYAENGTRIARLDVCVLANHGLNGEDGTLQGLLELSGIPYTGSGVRASSLAMDKIVMKQLFGECGLPILPYVHFDNFEYNCDLYSILTRIKDTLRFPIMVKPANLGSSIGISKAKDYASLFSSIRVALEWDNRVILENALENFTELNCAALVCGNECTVSEIEKPIGWKEFLTYEDKYMAKSFGSGREFPAKLTEELAQRIKKMTAEVCAAIGSQGIARVDFMLKDDNLYVNEINTIPGALANYLFSFEGGLTFTELIEKSITAAIERTQRQNKLKYSYKAPDTLKIQK